MAVGRAAESRWALRVAVGGQEPSSEALRAGRAAESYLCYSLTRSRSELSYADHGRDVQRGAERFEHR